MNKPIVFISSTIQGMRNTRTFIKDLIEKELGYHVLMSEYGGSKPITPLKQCKEWANECDIFIAILGKKYGSTIPRLEISVSELEFNEAYKDNPEKILVYISAQQKEQRQEVFEKRVTDFTKGYLRRSPFNDNNELRIGIRDDIANYFKERIDFIRLRNIRVKERITPSIGEYVTVNRRKRAERMMADTIEIAQQYGMSQVTYIRPYFWLATKTINRIKILFTINVVPDHYNRSALYHHNTISEKYRYDELYKEHKNRFAITLVSGNASLRSLEWLTTVFSGTCFKVEPGLFYGEGLSEKKEKPGKLYFENRLILSRIKDKQAMVVKLSDALEWLSRESKRINFKCNYEKPLKIKLRKWKR